MDLQRLPAIIKPRGYSDEDVTNIMHRNFCALSTRGVALGEGMILVKKADTMGVLSTIPCAPFFWSFSGSELRAQFDDTDETGVKA